MKVNLAPNSVTEEVTQNVATIIATERGSVPFDREFGIDRSPIDKPINIGRAKITADIVRTVRKYEPRATIKRIDWSDVSAVEGWCNPRAVIDIREDFDDE